MHPLSEAHADTKPRWASLTNWVALYFGWPQVIDDPGGSKLLLVMEFVEGGPLLTREALDKHEKLPESLARQYFRDIVKVGHEHGRHWTGASGRAASTAQALDNLFRGGCEHDTRTGQVPQGGLRAWHRHWTGASGRWRA